MKEIIIVTIAIIILGYMGINIKDILEGETVKNNFTFVWNLLASIWGNYIIPFINYTTDFIVNVLHKVSSGGAVQV